MSNETEAYEITLAAGARAEPGHFLTFQQAAALTGRSTEVIRKYVKDGVLPSRYTETVWPYRRLVLSTDLHLIASRPRWGIKRGRTRKPRLSEAGRTVAIRGETRTTSWEEPTR
jgi:hypothetical protein